MLKGKVKNEKYKNKLIKYKYLCKTKRNVLEEKETKEIENI